MTKLIRLENVIKMYDNGKRAMNDVSLHVGKHERICIFGTSGSGKTTLMKLVTGIEAPSSSSIYVDGNAVHEMDTDTAADFRNRTFGILSRQYGFMENLTILENAAMPLAARKVPVAERNKTAVEYLESLNIGHLIKAFPSQLSVMELRLAGLARALIGEPKILLIDNIDADLTSKEFKQIQGILNAAWKFSEITVIRFTDRENDDWPCDRRLCLEYGKLTEGLK